MSSTDHTAENTAPTSRGRAIGWTGLIMAIISGVIAVTSFLGNTANQDFIRDLAGSMAVLIPGVELVEDSKTDANISEMISNIGTALEWWQTDQAEQLYHSLINQYQLANTMIEQLNLIGSHMEDPSIIYTKLMGIKGSLEDNLCDMVSDIEAQIQSMRQDKNQKHQESTVRDRLVFVTGHFSGLGITCTE